MAIEHDATSSATSNTGNSTLSWSHTLGDLGNNGLIVVCAGGEELSPGSGNQTITGVTYNGTSMTQVSAGTYNASGHSCSAAMYALTGSSVPSSGTHTVVVSYTSSNHDASAAGCMSFKGIKDQAKETVNVTTKIGGSISTSITTATDGALVVSAYASQNVPNATSTTGDTRAFRAVPGSIEQMEACGYYRIGDDAGSHGVTLTTSNPESQVLITASFEASLDAAGNFFMLF